MVRVEADAVEQAGDSDTPAIRLRIDETERARLDHPNDGRALTLVLTITEAIAARDALNLALNALGLPDQE